MSVVISYTTDNLSIIATDTRVTYGKKTSFYNDNELKLLKLPHTSMGWISGVGFGCFLDYAKNIICSKKFKNPIEFINEYQLILEKSYHKYAVDKEDINKSIIAMSFSSIEENELVFRVIYLSKQFDNLVYPINKNEINILYPIDFIEEKNKVKSLNEKYNFKYQSNGDIVEIIQYILRVFEHISLESDKVSKICDLGIHSYNQDGFYKLHVKGSVEKLLEKIENNTLISEIEIINN